MLSEKNQSIISKNQPIVLLKNLNTILLSGFSVLNYNNSFWAFVVIILTI